MPLWLQLDLSSIPEQARIALPARLREGILQFFYCTDDECDNSDFGAFAHNLRARVVPASQLVELASAGTSDHEPQRIVGWKAERDLPGHAEAEVLIGHALNLHDAEAFYNAQHGDRRPLPAPGDKLLGWPDWIQGVYYPKCPTCGKSLTYVFQIASEDHVAYMFGDAGNGHLCFCEDHPDRGSFFWSCC